MHLKNVTLRFALALLFGSGAQAQSGPGQDWPQWRGPQRTGVSTETAWSSVGQATPLWQKDIGIGHSSFAISNGRAFTLGYDVEAGQDTVFCLDAATGDEQWSYSYASEIWDQAHDGGAQTTPTVVGDEVFTSNREGKVFCFDVPSGDLKWQRDLRAEKELEPPTWGFSASPLVLGDLVILNVDRVVALDRASGEDVWVSEKNYGIAYSTPASFEHEGEGHLAVLAGDGLVVLAQDSGAEVAFHSWVKPPQIYPMTPVVIGDRIFISAGYDRGSTMLQLADGELRELWSSRKMRNKMSGCVLWRDHLFGFDESILKCMSLDGEVRWKKRGLGTGSMVIAGGRMVILDGKGQLIIAEANPEEYVELSRQDVFEEGTSWSTPVLSHGRVYCRSSLGPITCLDYRGSAEPVAAVRPAPQGELPTGAALFERHLAAVGGAESFGKVRSLRLTGTGESLRNTVRTGQVELYWDAAAGFSWQDESGFQMTFNPEAGWLVGGGSAPLVLEGEELDAVREAGNLGRIFVLEEDYTDLSEVTFTVFDNRDCYALEARTKEGYARTLYFEAESGLLAGHQGEGVLLWTLGDYREFDGVRLPTTWAFYEAEKGEMNSATFDAAEVNPEGIAERFAVPATVRLFMRSPEEVTADNARLAAAHGELLGLWQDGDQAEAPAVRVGVAEGFLMYMREGRDPDPLSEPDDRGRLFMIGREYVSFELLRDSAGQLEAIQVKVDDEPRARLVRVSD